MRDLHHFVKKRLVYTECRKHENVFENIHVHVLDDYPLGGLGLGLFDPIEIVNYSRPKDSDAEV